MEEIGNKVLPSRLATLRPGWDIECWFLICKAWWWLGDKHPDSHKDWYTENCSMIWASRFYPCITRHLPNLDFTVQHHTAHTHEDGSCGGFYKQVVILWKWEIRNQTNPQNHGSSNIELGVQLADIPRSRDWYYPSGSQEAQAPVRHRPLAGAAFLLSQDLAHR